MALTPDKKLKLRENIGFNKNSIELSSHASDNRNLLKYIKDFYKKNNIDFKYIGESIIIYPTD